MISISVVKRFFETLRFSHRIFAERIDALASQYARRWRDTIPAFASRGRLFSLAEQHENEMMVRESLPTREGGPLTPEQQRYSSAQLKNSVRNIILQTISSGRRLEVTGLLDSFFSGADQFAHRAKNFDANLQNDGIFQALRNLWIVNSLQAAFGVPVRLSPSGFAYSLLYTYTDNYLDDTCVPKIAKEAFGSEFERRLEGLEVDSAFTHWSRIQQLVRMIEDEYPRSTYPEVYQSLLAIHRAQQNSLNQCDQTGNDILELSIRKGGTSVLADGYMAKGRLTATEREFSFGYGVFLQLLDDLQDVEEDLQAGSETLFTQAARRGTLDKITMRLAAFIQNTLDSISPIVRSRLVGLSELVLQSCSGIILESIALHPEKFSAELVNHCEVYSPLTFDAIRSLHREYHFSTADSSVEEESTSMVPVRP